MVHVPHIPLETLLTLTQDPKAVHTLYCVWSQVAEAYNAGIRQNPTTWCVIRAKVTSEDHKDRIQWHMDRLGWSALFQETNIRVGFRVMAFRSRAKDLLNRLGEPVDANPKRTEQ